PLVEFRGIGRVALRQPRIDDLDAAAEFNAEGVRALAHAVFAPHEQGGPKPLVDEAGRGADDLLLFAFGEDDALRAAPQPLVNTLENPCPRIAARSQLRPVGSPLML